MDPLTVADIGSLPTSRSISTDFSMNERMAQRALVRRSTAEFVQHHMTQPSALEPPIFRDNEGFITEEEADKLERRQYGSPKMASYAQKLTDYRVL
jgi:hypothetical protein